MIPHGLLGEDYLHARMGRVTGCLSGKLGKPHVCITVHALSLRAKKCEVLLTHRAMATMSQDPGGLCLTAMWNQPPASVG